MVPPTPSERGSSRRIAILGAGPGGLCMGVRLKQAGLEDFVLLERGDGVGGTWRQNVYPGCACDIQSHLYSFSFDIKRDWSRPYAPQPEILAYMEDLAEKFGLLPHCRFGTEVTAARFLEDSGSWALNTTAGETLEADVLVSAVGVFNDLHYPEIEGMERFRGAAFHSAEWPRDHDLAGRTVGVIGSAASAVQFVPEIVRDARQVHLFQRTANWILPKEDVPYTAAQLEHFRSDPEAARTLRQEIYDQVDGGMTFSDPVMLAEIEKIGLAVLQQVEDEDVRAKLTPTHPWGCKRPLYSNDYYAAFNRDNLELVTEPIAAITESGIRTEDGAERALDTLVYATGFDATRFASVIDVIGRGGRSLNEAWRDGAAAYLGVTTAGFPNLFMLYGPNTNNGSILTMIESQVGYAMRQIERLVAEDLAWIDVRPEAMARYNAGIQEGIDGVTVWNAGCPGYYRTPSGRVVTQWPYSMSAFEAKTHEADDALYEKRPR